MDDDTRDMARRFDNLEADPAKLELFGLLYTIEDLILKDVHMLAYDKLAIDSAITQALGVVRLLPNARS